MPSRTISDVMTPDPIVMSPQATVREAARAMRDSSIGDVLVATDGRLQGIVTDRDLVIRCIADGVDPDDARLADLCTTELVTVRPDTPIDQAVIDLRDHAVRRLPVVDGDRIVGIVSIGDLAIARDGDSALADISAAPPTD